jgi:aminomuconate-semialdehyde/2-hydroxymuconate-6-semialdehyde dehydrogenase
MERFDNFIAGSYKSSPELLNVFEPATGEVYAQVANACGEDLEEAVEQAKAVKEDWANCPISERSRILHRMADLIEENLEVFAQAETKNTGKPITASRTIDIPRAAANFRFFASAIVNMHSEAHLQEGEAVNYTRRKSLGIVGCISPWNLPLYLFTWKIAPALAMGNCVIGKPSEITPHTAFLLGKIANQSGLPKGVLSILHGRGPGIGQLIVDHPAITAISFTGGTATGKAIARSAAGQLKKVSLELGGKNPVIVFEDADIEKTVKEVVRSAFSNQGQICLCGSRILVHSSVYSAFKRQLIAETSLIKPENPVLENTRFGALISKQHLGKVDQFVGEAVRAGGRILTGGKIESVETLEDGYFYQPTILEGLSPSCQINQEEVFGPVITLQSFKEESEAVALANDVDYGLAASLWTNDVSRAHRLSHALESGIVWVNCWMHRDLRTPFGGMKMSGVGREGGTEALRFFSEPQNICIKL